MRFVKNYMRDEKLRHALNELTRETYGFDFESWVTNGYFEDDYIPYSYEEDGRIIANVSVNLMNFIQNGQEKYYIQLGTVMTKKEFRNRGYARRLMEKVIADYSEKCDGIYLFGNLKALEFYDKLGFLRGTQYRYILKVDAGLILQKKANALDEVGCFKKVDATEPLQKIKYMEALRNSAVNAALDQKNKYALQMFYTAEMEQVYYSEKLDCYVIMEANNNTLCLQSVVCQKSIRLEDVIGYIKGEYDTIILGFAPCKEDVELFEAHPFDGEEDYRLFYMGKRLESIEKEKLYFPELSHA